MDPNSYSRMRDLQAIDALDEQFPLTVAEHAEMVYLQLMIKFGVGGLFSDSDWH